MRAPRCRLQPETVGDMIDGDELQIDKDGLVFTMAGDALILVGACKAENGEVVVRRVDGGIEADVSKVSRSYRWPRRGKIERPVLRVTKLIGMDC